MAALSLSVHSATTLARISFMYSMNAFNGFLMCGFFFSGTIKCLPTDKTNKYIFLFFIRPRLPTFVCTLFLFLFFYLARRCCCCWAVSTASSTSNPTASPNCWPLWRHCVHFCLSARKIKEFLNFFLIEIIGGIKKNNNNRV